MLEPFWSVLNRHLCMLEPFENLRRGGQSRQRSISLDYNSLPPQLVLWKAIKHGYYLLALVCMMSLLSHLFAVCISVMFFEDRVLISHAANYSQPFGLRFKPLNGSAPPFIPDQDDNTASMNIAVSNMTASTPLPPWSDDEWFYLPIDIPIVKRNSSWQYRLTTPAIRGVTSCSTPEYNLSLSGRPTPPAGQTYTEDPQANMIFQIPDGDRVIQCVP